MLDLIYILAGLAVLGLYALLRRRAAEDLSPMIVELIYAAGALVIAGYMIAALLRPDRF